jgi:hypothetical protein
MRISKNGSRLPMMEGFCRLRAATTAHEVIGGCAAPAKHAIPPSALIPSRIVRD